MHLAIPVHADAPNYPGEANVGSAFLGLLGAQLYLVSAAHVPIESRPTDDWSLWPKSLNVHLLGLGHVEVPLFDGESPKFGFHINSEGAFIDVMWMQLEDSDPLTQALTASYFTFQLQAKHGAAGEKVKAYGYPQAETWPPITAETVTGVLLDTSDNAHITAELPTLKGYSGGPVVAEIDNRLIGMTVGNVTDASSPAVLVTAHAIWSMIFLESQHV